MTTAHYLVTVHLNIDLPLALLQPEPADAPTGPELEAHAGQGCGNCIALEKGTAWTIRGQKPLVKSRFLAWLHRV